MTFGDHPILDYVMKLRQAMLRRDQAVLADLARQYAAAYKELSGEIGRFALAIRNTQPTPGQLQNLASLQSLLGGIRSEMGQFAGLLADQVGAATLAEIQAAGVDSLSMVQRMLPGMDTARLVGTWARLAPKQIYTMYGFLDPDGPLYAAIRFKFSQAAADKAREIILKGYIQGMNPREIARLVAKGCGVGLDWALNTARTASLWSYRVASHMNYLNNSHVVRAWIWFAQLDDRICLSCVNQHGRTFPLTEVLADHHRGRCTPLPVTATYAELGIMGVDDIPLNIQRGEDWFNGLSQAAQRSMMGPAMFKAWQDGAFQFGQLSQVYNDKVYGRMIREASLKGILGDKAAIYYD
jgi:hypothetical protein